MTTTLPLIETTKIDRRKNGEISWVRALVMLDGTATGADFRARVGEEPIAIDGDTITVSDAQVEALRQGRAMVARQQVEQLARRAAELSAALDRADAMMVGKGASDEARAELAAHITAYADDATSAGGYSATRDRYFEGRRAIMARHGLLG